MSRLARDLRCLQVSQSVGGYALIVNVKGEAARSFYLPLGGQPGQS